MILKERPAQWQADVAEIVAAYEAGGKALAERTYKAICNERKLMLWVQLALADDFRKAINGK